MKNAYLDEYGNTGDIINYDPSNPYGGQYIFCLSALICKQDEEELINDYFKTIPTSLFIDGELKSTKIIFEQLDILEDILDIISSFATLPHVEIVDKKYLATGLIVNYFVLPPFEFDVEDPQKMNEWKCLANYFADIIYNEADSELYTEFQKLANNCNDASFEDFFIFIDKIFPNLNHKDKDYIIEAVNETRDSFNSKIHQYRDVSKIFLEDFSIGRKPKPIFIAPNLTSFTNLYARLSALKIDNIYHDEQQQFQEIMKLHKIKLIEIAQHINFDGNGFNNCDIRDIKLDFIDSKTSFMIQVSDLLAGFIGRMEQKHLNNISISEAEKKLLYKIKNFSINYVGMKSKNNLWV